MFKTEEQINERLNSSKNLVNRFSRIVVDDNISPAPSSSLPEVEIIPLGNPGNVSKPKLSGDEKDEIAFRARAGENQTSLAAEFGVSQSAIGEIEQGRTKVNEVAVQSRLDQVQDVAMTKLLESIGYISTDKLDKCKATDLSSIAANMSKVVSNVRTKSNDTGPVVNVNVYAPELRNERTFKTIEV